MSLSFQNPIDDEITRILKESRKIAVVGLSPKVERDSNMVARYLIEKGYQVIPVNPGQKEILTLKCYPNILEIPERIDIVDLFLNPSRVPPVIEQAIELGVKVVWMQLGVIDENSAKKALDAGITVVMDRCIKQEQQRLIDK
jgi:hypothetical protein